MRAERTAVLIIFGLNGMVFGSWAPRIPALAAQTHAEAGALGLALLCGSIGLIAAASVSGRLCARYGARALVLIAALATAAMPPLLSLAPSPVVLGVVLFWCGAANGMFDVAMNIAAVTVVRRTGRPLMPVFHAGFSFGGLLGAAGAAVAAASHIGLRPHFGLVAIVVAVVVLAVARRIPRELAATSATPHHVPRRGLLRRPVLWLLGAVVFCSAVVEGASSDWSALFAVRERGLDEAAAAIVYAAFSIAMAVTRLLGERAERRWGPYRLLAGGALTAATGLLLAVLAPGAPATYLGFVLTGVGVAFCFPVALGLAGAVGRRADGSGGEREIGFVTTIAYGGFMLGPPMIGGIAQLTNLAVALGVAGLIASLIAPAALATAAARRREDQQARPVAAEDVAA